MPLILRGARQVGKTYLVQAFARQQFENMVIVNFEENAGYAQCFSQLDPKQICLQLEVLLEQPIRPGKTLLFLDEIQNCSQAITALRYFYEKMPELHVIAAGSLLEFSFSDDNFSMPVGRVEYLYLMPMNFKEFAYATGASEFIKYIEQVDWKSSIPPVIHQRGIDLIKQYSIVGGMPKVVHAFKERQSLNECQHLQAQIINTYRDDFNKYGKRIDSAICEVIFNKASNLLCKNFKYTEVDPDLQSKQIKPALLALIKAGVYRQIILASASGIPLNSNLVFKKFKLLFLDIGLIKQMTRLGAEVLQSDNLHLIHQGALMEQLVGQELLTYQPMNSLPELFYWRRDKRGSQAELDYLIQIKDQIVPIEVKSGKSGRLRSLQLFMQEQIDNKLVFHYGIKISQDNFHKEKTVLSLPFYMISELERLIQVI